MKSPVRFARGTGALHPRTREGNGMRAATAMQFTGA